MLHKSLYSEEEQQSVVSTLYCKCLNTQIDFINQSLHIDNTDYEFECLETCLENESETAGTNPTVFCRSFLLSINIKFKWLIGVRLISYANFSYYLYKCNCCSYDLFVATNNILGKSLLNFELQNFNKDILLKKVQYSPLFDILLEDNYDNYSDYSNTVKAHHPLTHLKESLRETEENAMKRRIEEFRYNEESKFDLFCDTLEREYRMLSEYAYDHNDHVFEHFKIGSLLLIEKDFNHLMEENLKLDHEEVYTYLNLNDNDDNSDNWLELNDIHRVKIKLPLNEMGDVRFNPSIDDANDRISNDRISNDRTSNDRISLRMLDDADALTDPSDDDYDEDENIGFDAISEEEEDNEQLMFEIDNNRIPELNISNTHSAEYTYGSGSIIQEDSETDDRLFGGDSPDTKPAAAAFTRSRGVAAVSNINMLSPMTSSTFKIQSSKSLQIKPSFRSRSLLSKTLNKNSALVNLNDRNQFETDNAKYHENASNDNDNDMDINTPTIHPKTFNPPKQWLDYIDNNHNHSHSNNHNSNKRNRAISKQNGKLIVNNHTFTGIWAKTLPQSGAKNYFFEEDDDDEDEKDKDTDTARIHSLFDTKQSQPSNNVYAYTMSTKYSRKETQ